MTWDEYFIGLARAIATKSKDPKTKVGCVIVDQNNRVVSTGYNGFAPKVYESSDRWSREQKHDYVIHAELNAVLHGKQDMTGCIAYCTLEPCQHCASALVSAGITRVVFDEVRENKIARSIFSEAGVSFTRLEYT